ncbi:zf-PARP-domain-containing protein [Basidiobolus meristosporus CBS 931.73]|uniref:Zf-PARP-domain-containing protein n=1 Tax=Basidiobolus meristosporus CBS 931.73 TaxID=1314790 RepID=A0A1Y1Z121_9FUNG|nr:zf-PARP-domain-containing protein [Basidiobolus meristosporus CBS 931.73]|eukprot:ORY03983.1 zf-PARP-domain-containing protein [Basidiobolus meristosporus CBS 931.73]
MPYVVEYARSGRSKCKGPKSCVDKVIPKGALRLGSVTERNGMEQTFWRHWNCVTPKILESIDEVENLDGFEELLFEDKEIVEEAVRTRSLPNKDDEDQDQESNPKETAKKDAPMPKKRSRATKNTAPAEDEAPKKRGKKAKEAPKSDSEEESKPTEKKSKNAAPKRRTRKAPVPSNSESESE